MKKKAFIIAGLCALSLLTWHVQAQDYTRDSLIMSITGPDGDTNVAFNFPTFLEMRDHTLLTRLFLKSQTDSQYLGDWFYRVSPQNNAVIDSVFLEVDEAFLQQKGFPSLSAHNADKGYHYDDGSRVLLAQNPMVTTISMSILSTTA